MSFYDASSYTIYKDRANEARMRLLADGETVADNSVTRAVLRVERPDDDDLVVDSDVGGSGISLAESATVVEIGSESFDGVAPGTYNSWLTVYQGGSDGIAWARPVIEVVKWPTT